MLAQLGGLSGMGAIPWLAVCDLFRSKVDGIMDMGRWLFVLVPNAEVIINDHYERWSRILLGVDWWRNAGVCASEVGWHFSGFARVVYSVATRRAKWWIRGVMDWHAKFFVTSNTRACGWASCSTALLSRWSILDWPEWVSPGATIDSYREYVRSKLSSAYLVWWSPMVERHGAQIPYSQFVGSPGTSILVWRRLSLPAAALVQMRSLCRFRCGQLVLRHLDNKVSSAHCQTCIFCGITVRNATVHCLSSCPHWSSFRKALGSALSRPSTDDCQKFALLALRAESRDAVAVMCGWAARMDQECRDFWHRR